VHRQAGVDTGNVNAPHCRSDSHGPCFTVPSRKSTTLCWFQAGMDMGIVNALHCESDKYEKLDKELLGFIEDVLLNRCENATERMMEYAATIDPKSKPTAVRKLGACCFARKLGACSCLLAQWFSCRNLRFQHRTPCVLRVSRPRALHHAACWRLPEAVSAECVVHGGGSVSVLVLVPALSSASLCWLHLLESHQAVIATAAGDTDTGDKAGGPKAASWRDESVEKRLAHALVKGIDEFAVAVRPNALGGCC